MCIMIQSMVIDMTLALVETRYLVTLSDLLSTYKIMSILVGAKNVQFCSLILVNINKIACQIICTFYLCKAANDVCN